MNFMKYTALAGALALSGCIDVDLTTTITGPETARLTGYMEVQSDILNMMGGADEFCKAEEGGTLVMTDTTARCNILIEGSFTEVFEGENGEPSPTATDLGDGTVRVEFPLATMTAQSAGMRDDPAAANMMRPMLEGHTFTVRVAGAEIVSTNGLLGEDGKSASFTFPLIEILNPDYAMPDVFETVVRY